MHCGVEPRGASTFVGFVVQASFEFVIILLPQLPVLELMCVSYHILLINSFCYSCVPCHRAFVYAMKPLLLSYPLAQPQLYKIHLKVQELVCVFIFGFFETEFPCSFGTCPGTCFVDQVIFKLRSACPCLSIAGVKGMHHLCPAGNLCFILSYNILRVKR